MKTLLKSLHILLFSRGFFIDNPLFSNALSLITTKNGKFDQCLLPPEPLRGVLFSSKGSVGAAMHSPFIHGGLRSTFLPIGARLGMADGANFYLEMG